MTELRLIRIPRTLYVRETIATPELSEAQGRACSLLWRALQAQGKTSQEHIYVRYHSISETEADVEVGLPIDESVIANDDSVSLGFLHEGPALTHRHIGSHQNLGEAYAALAAGDTNGLAAAGVPWEVYEWFALDRSPDTATWPAPDDWRTTLVQPLARQGSADE